MDVSFFFTAQTCFQKSEVQEIQALIVLSYETFLMAFMQLLYGPALSPYSNPQGWQE
jgi:hypothetical protein